MIESNLMYKIIIIVIILSIIVDIKKMSGFIMSSIHVIFIAYTGLVLSITLFPIPFQAHLISDMNKEHSFHNSYIPFADIIKILENQNLMVKIKQLVGNVILFGPLGFLIPFLKKRFMTFKSIIIYGIACSLIIELLQSIISIIIGVQYKISSVDDVILNTLGCITGYICFRLLKFITNDFLFLKYTKFKFAPSKIRTK